MRDSKVGANGMPLILVESSPSPNQKYTKVEVQGVTVRVTLSENI